LMFASPQLLFYCIASILLHAPEVHSLSILLQNWLQKLNSSLQSRWFTLLLIPFPKF